MGRFTQSEEGRRDELIRIIEHSVEKLTLAEAEQKKEILEKLLTAEERFRTECVKCVSITQNFCYSWIFDYYPTTVHFDVSSVDQKNREIVWDLKNDPDKSHYPYTHYYVLKGVVPRIKRQIMARWGRRNIKELTLVCVPASTQVKNKARYEAFSKMLCEETGMENGYEHVHFIKDGISKKSPNNGIGISVRPEVTFDDWFKGRFVVLFDDVVTKGETMLYYKNMLQKVGAIVVGGLGLGKTKHDPPITLPPLIVEYDEDDITGS